MRAADGGIGVSADHAEEVVAALADLKQSAGMETPVPLQQANADEVEWAVLWWEETAAKETVGLLLAPPGSTVFSLETDWHLVLERQDGQLKVIAWGETCGARPALPADGAWAQIALPDRAPTPAGTTVNVLISERGCTGARDPEPFLAAEPVIVETDQEVTVYWTTDKVTEGATCPGNPWVERTLQLDRPLGQRTLQDGSTWPPAPVTTVDGH